jgi:hypothetical protein
VYIELLITLRDVTQMQSTFTDEEGNVFDVFISNILSQNNFLFLCKHAVASR